MILALFDFDGTITNSDSLFKFIKFVKGNFKFYLGLLVLSPILFAFKIQLIPNYKAKKMMLSWYFKGIKEEIFLELATQYSLGKLNSIIRSKAIERIEWHKKKGHTVIVVSASAEYWLKPWCESRNLELISTKLEVQNGLITGNFIGKNCNGEEKVNRIKEKISLDIVNYIYAYGDSIGDREMLAIANESYLKFFN